MTETHHIRIGRRSPVSQPTKPPAKRGNVVPVKIKNGTFTRRGRYIEK